MKCCVNRELIGGLADLDCLCVSYSAIAESSYIPTGIVVSDLANIIN